MPIKNILVVDDSPTDRQFLSELLAKNGFRVTTAQSADEALAKADRAWLGQLITRRLPADRWADALEKGPDDIKVVIEMTAI